MEHILKRPTFLINLDRSQDRLQIATQRIYGAGFTDVRRIQAVDGLDSNMLKEEWESHGNPPFNKTYAANGEGIKFTYTHPCKQACMLSHLKVWQTIINDFSSASDSDTFTVFEDDVLFHSEWMSISTTYMSQTPLDFDILFIGNQIATNTDDAVIRIHTYCTHAYIITRAGARKLYDAIISMPDGLYTIDMMLVDLMKQSVPPFSWYCWNVTRKFPCRYLSSQTITHEWMIRNTGAVFQDHNMVTLIGGY
jgi:GR25 family glycosyltransferase involved in LPS biosynthesis